MKGEGYWFNAEEIKEVLAHNRQYKLVPPAILYFNKYYEVVIYETEGNGRFPPLFTTIYERVQVQV